MVESKRVAFSKQTMILYYTNLPIHFALFLFSAVFLYPNKHQEAERKELL